jgi:hypothetical protein
MAASKRSFGFQKNLSCDRDLKTHFDSFLLQLSGAYALL